ncbi:MAG: sugar ABC transporter substrate-binding protein [Bacteroidetes bacterium]|nr:sugar ABC transporter substrate-binding protein [Bacteroidota bacterium]
MTTGVAGPSALFSGFPEVRGKVPTHLGYIKNFSFHVWYRVVEQYLRLRAARYGIPQCTVLDAELDLQTQLQALDSLIRQGVNALVVTPVPGPGTEEILRRTQRAGIPVVIEANPVPGMSTLVAICDYDAGWKTGVWMGRYLSSHSVTRAVVLDVAYPLLRPCLLRSEGFLDGLRSVIPDTVLKARVNGEARVETAKMLTKEVLAAHKDVNVVFGMDDESLQGALQGALTLGRTPEDIALAGFGLAGDTDKELLLTRGHFKTSLAMFPEWVGVRCVDQAVRLFNGAAVPLHDVAPTVPVTPDTLPTYYTRTGKTWIPDFSSINAIQREEECSRV